MKYRCAIILASFALGAAISPAQTASDTRIDGWVTTADGASRLEPSPSPLGFGGVNHSPQPVIVIDPNEAYQPIEGFGFALTDGTAELLHKMSAGKRAALLQEIFGAGPGSIGVTFIRITIGSSDMNGPVYSYDDLPPGETDPELKRFDLGGDKADLLPMLKEILAIAPHLRILGSPWSAPAWMKTNQNVRGGALKEDCYGVYARYLARWAQEMEKQGIPIDALTIQNEPLNNQNTPSMQWTVRRQQKFLREDLIPVFTAAGIKARLWLWDHNTDRIDYPLTLLADPVISQFAAGMAFHNYLGEMSALSQAHAARPDKPIYFTEQTVIEKPDGALNHIAANESRVLIAATRNWARSLILWNLGADPNNGPHTGNGGCDGCQGAVTLDGDNVTRNVAFYAMGHLARFVPPGSLRIASTGPGDTVTVLTEDEEQPQETRVAIDTNVRVLPNVAFRTPDGKIVLLVANDTQSTGSFDIQYNGRLAHLQLNPGAVGTYVWPI